MVTDVVAYRTVLDDTQREGDPDVYRLLLEGRIDVVTFTSASAVRNFVKIYGAEQAADLLKNTAVAVDRAGDRRSGARSSASPSTIQPTTYTMPALVDAIVAHYAEYARSGCRRRASPVRDDRMARGRPTWFRSLGCRLVYMSSRL